MLISAPRSASTWASVWLTTDTTLCLHDPLWRVPYQELDAITVPKVLGIACTGIALFPQWVNAHPARKVIVHRDFAEIDASLEKIGLSACSGAWEGVLDRISGVHVDWQDLFERPKIIYEFLLDKPFDELRHAALREINMQPAFAQLSIDRGATQRLIRELEYARAH
jgi:hypothetical protein